jgi:hypothetical protein
VLTIAARHSLLPRTLALFVVVAHTSTFVREFGKFEREARKNGSFAALVGAFGAGVLFKGFLGEAVEGERGHGAFEMRGGDAPGAVGATPAGEVITFDPNQALITHTSTFCACVLRFGLGRGGAEHINRSSAEGGLLPAGVYFPRNRRETK